MADQPAATGRDGDAASGGFLERIGAWPIAGIVVTAMVGLTFWQRNVLRLGYESVWPTLLATLAIAALITGLLWLASRSAAKAGLGAALVAVYLFYAPVLLEKIGLNYLGTMATHLVAIALLVFAYRKLPSDRATLRRRAGQINLVVLVLLAVTAVPLLVRVAQLESGRGTAVAQMPQLAGEASADSPDVWHILFDRYASNATLQKQYGYDNTPFLDALRTRGFAVKEDAYSNYQRTGHSVASTLNGALLDPVAATMDEEPGDWVPIYRAMRDGAALRAFDRMGYRTVFAGSWWEPTRFSNIASETISIRTVPQMTRLLIDHSAIGFWLRPLAIPMVDGRGDQCFRASEKFRRLAEVAQRDERKQVFAHFLVPHPPFVLNADGTCRALDKAVDGSRRDNYIAQVRFSNANMLKLVDAILAGPRPATIVIHSDEGPWPAPYVGNEHGLGTDPVQVPWTKLTRPQLEEKFGILMAVRAPDGAQPATMPQSPVQIYPAILRDYFGSDAPLPPSRHEVFESDDALYRFHDVAGRLGQGAQAAR